MSRSNFAPFNALKLMDIPIKVKSVIYKNFSQKEANCIRKSTIMFTIVIRKHMSNF